MKRKRINIRHLLDMTIVRIFLVVFLVVLVVSVASAVIYSVRRNKDVLENKSNYILTIESILKDKYKDNPDILKSMTDFEIMNSIEEIFNRGSRLPLFSEFYLPETLDLDNIDRWQFYNQKHSHWSREDITPWLFIPKQWNRENLMNTNDDLIKDLLDNVP